MDNQSVFITGTYNQGRLVKNYLESVGINCMEENFISYYTIEVDKKDYLEALKTGVDFAVKNKLNNVCWVDAQGDRQTNSTGAWPVVYGVMNREKFGLNKTTKKWGYVVCPDSWHENGANETCPNPNIDISTPAVIVKMFKDLKALTSYQIITKYSNSESALDIRAICPHAEHETVREKVLKYLDENKIFDKVMPQTLDGVVLENQAKNYTEDASSKRVSDEKKRYEDPNQE